MFDQSKILLKKAMLLAGCASLLGGCLSVPKRTDLTPDPAPVADETEVPLQDNKKTLDVLLELGSLDRDPISFNDEGWLIQKNSLYGYVSAQGELIIEPKYTDINMVWYSEKQRDGIYLYNGIMDPEYDAYLPYNYVLDKNAAYGIGSGAASGGAFRASDGSIVYRDALGNPCASSEVFLSSAVSLYADGISREEIPSSDYYIYLPEYGQTAGPFRSKQAVSFNQQHPTQMGLFWNTPLGETFVLPQTQSCSLLNIKNNTALCGFDSLQPIDTRSFGGRKNGSYYIYTHDLQLEYAAAIDRGALNLHGNVPILEDGSWKIVTLSSLLPARPADVWTPEKQENVIARHSVPETPAASAVSIATGLYKLDADLNVRTKPDKNSESVDVKRAGRLVHVSQIQQDASGRLWGKLGEERWICLVSDTGTLYAAYTDPNGMNMDQLKTAILDHYNYLVKPDGFYSCITDYEQMGQETAGIVRFAGNNATTPNVYAFKVYVNFATGAVHDEANLDHWNFKQ